MERYDGLELHELGLSVPMSETIEVEVSSEALAAEVGYGIIGRAQQIHDNPDDEFEHHAEELKELGQGIVDQYER